MKKALSAKNLWEAAPRPVRAAAGALLRAVPLPWLFGRRFRAVRRFVDDAQFWSVEQIRQYQLERLRDVVALAYRRTKHYRRAFSAVGFEPGDLRSLTDFSALPTIDRSTLQDHLNDMLTVAPQQAHVDFVSTGGSSGRPLHFYINAERSAIEFAYLTDSWSRVGFRPGDTLAVLRGRVVSRAAGGLQHEYDPLLRHHYYSTFHMTDEQMARYVEHIRSIGRCFLHAYPSSAFRLARFLRRSGIPAPRNIRAVIAESEIVYPEQRDEVERVFACRYFSCYGHTEKLIFAAECEHSTCEHVSPTYGYCELLDEDGRLVTEPGSVGELVGTGFINTTVPFIRYRTGDYARLVATRCDACDRNHMVLTDIRGHRTQELLVAADGSRFSWTALNMHDDTFVRVRQFQIYQDTPGRAVLRIVPAGPIDEAEKRKILRQLAPKIEGRLELTIEVCDDIALTARGKATYVEQRIPPDAERAAATDVLVAAGHSCAAGAGD